jgi:hypothetical protein
MRPHTDFKLLSLSALILALVLAGCGRTKPAPNGAGSQALAISNRLAAITAAGEPVTLEQLGRIYEVPPDAQNAAPLYAQAFAAVKTEGLNTPTFLANNQEALASVRAPLFEAKVVEHIVSQSKVTDKEVSKEELMKQDDEDVAV